jgi:hypothetical protein
MRCAPHIEGQFLRDEITRLVKEGKGLPEVYELLEKHQVYREWRQPFYEHAIAVSTHAVPTS